MARTLRSLDDIASEYYGSQPKAPAPVYETQDGTLDFASTLRGEPYLDPSTPPAPVPTQQTGALPSYLTNPKIANNPWVKQNISDRTAENAHIEQIRANDHSYNDRNLLGSVGAGVKRAINTFPGLALNAAKAVLPQSEADSLLGQEMNFQKESLDRNNELYGMNKELRASIPGKILSGAEQMPANIAGAVAMGGIGYPVFAGISTYGEYKFQGEEAIKKAEQQLKRPLADNEKADIRDRFSGLEAGAGAATETIFEMADMKFGILSKILP